jgi:hypothetical protein
VSPPSTVPGASIRPAIGTPRSVSQRCEELGLAGPVGLAGPERDRAVGRDEERVEDVAQVRVGVGLVVEAWTRTPSPSRAATSRRARAAARSRSHGQRKPWADRRTRARTRARALDEDVAEGRGRAADSDATSGDHAARIRRRSGFPAVRAGVGCPVSGVCGDARGSRRVTHQAGRCRPRLVGRDDPVADAPRG